MVKNGPGKPVTKYSPLALSVTEEGVEALVKYYEANKESKKVNFRADGWDNDMKALRNAYCISLLSEEGFTKHKTKKTITEKFGVTETTAQLWVDEALRGLVEIRTPAEKEKYANLIVSRLESIYSRAYQIDKLDTAIKALDAQAKILGISSDQVQNNVQMVYQFKFGE